MTPAQLLAKLRQAGVEVSVHGDQLHLRAPKGVLTDEIKRAVVEHKAALIAQLRGPLYYPNAKDGGCALCGSREWWQHPVDGMYRCGRCHPRPRHYGAA